MRDQYHVDPAFLADPQLLQVTAMLGQEIAPACAILSGLVSQELIKVLSRRDAPYHNMLVVDTFDTEGVVMQLGLV
jgi:hypothetical protein